MKCSHPNCKYEADGPGELCYGHRELIKSKESSVLICYNCGHLLKVFQKPLEDFRKYVFAAKCRYCDGTEEDEKVDEELNRR